MLSLACSSGNITFLSRGLRDQVPSSSLLDKFKLLWPSSKRKRSSSSSSSTLLCRSFSSSLEAPDVARLAQTARITLTPKEVEDFAPKIKKVVDWFGQLQTVNLESIEPSVRADTEVSVSPREDRLETFENREAILAAIPSYSDPYIKVPKVLNKD